MQSGRALTSCRFSCVVASCIEKVSMKLVFKKLTDGSALGRSAAAGFGVALQSGRPIACLLLILRCFIS